MNGIITLPIGAGTGRKIAYATDSQYVGGRNNSKLIQKGRPQCICKLRRFKFFFGGLYGDRFRKESISFQYNMELRRRRSENTKRFEIYNTRFLRFLLRVIPKAVTV